MQIGSFARTSPGHACKLAAARAATWTTLPNSTVREARDAEGALVAYRDRDGWFVHRSYARLDMSDVIA